MKMATRERMAAWLDGQCERTTVIAPRLVEGSLLYRPVASSGEVEFDFQRADMSPKTHLLPATEVLLQIDKRGSDVQLTEVIPGNEQVLFGVRPCDARGLKVLDALLVDHEPSDAYYAERRERTTLILSLIHI